MTAIEPQETAGLRIFEFDRLEDQERYKLLSGFIVPRPIAWITTCDQEGRVNAAPFSFFNVLCSDPPLLAVGIERRAGGEIKDTARNIRLSKRFTVNIVDRHSAPAMMLTAAHFPPDESELAAAKLSVGSAPLLDPPAISAAPAAFSCELHTIIEPGPACEIFIGVVKTLQVRDILVDERFYVDTVKIDAVGRLGGGSYCSTTPLLNVAPSPK